MSLPVPGFTLEPAAVEALAAELDALAGELSEDADAALSAAAALPRAIDGETGWSAGAAATAWASVERILASRTEALAAALRATVVSYRAEDVYLAERVGTAGPFGRRTPR
jgi:hypothetical protein